MRRKLNAFINCCPKKVALVRVAIYDGVKYMKYVK